MFKGHGNKKKISCSLKKGKGTTKSQLDKGCLERLGCLERIGTGIKIVTIMNTHYLVSIDLLLRAQMHLGLYLSGRRNLCIQMHFKRRGGFLSKLKGILSSDYLF